MGNTLCPWRAAIAQMGGWALGMAATSYVHSKSGHPGPFVCYGNLIRAPCCAASDKENPWGAVVVCRICLGAPWRQPEGPDALRMTYSPHDTAAPSHCSLPSTNYVCHRLGHSPFLLAFSCPPPSCAHGFLLEGQGHGGYTRYT